MITNKLKNYLTPQEREISSEWQIQLISSEVIEQSNFWDDLFMNEVGSIWRRLFLLKCQDDPFSLIKSFIPQKLVRNKPKQSNDISKQNLELQNLELDIDCINNADRIKKNILLTWPTSEECRLLLLKQESQVFVEKNYILCDKNIIRYEEEIIIPDKIEYED